jgi:hypothetical protein
MPDEPPNEMLFHSIPREYAVQIAHVVTGWAQVEHDIDAAIWELANLYDTPDIGACLTAQFTTVNARLNALISLARVRGIPDFQIGKLNKFRDRATALADRRNRVAHDPWLSAYGKGLKELGKVYRLQKTARSKLDYSYKLIALGELEALTKEIEEAYLAFSELYSEICQLPWS